MRSGKENRRDSQSRFVLEGNALYEIDEECMRQRRKQLEEMERRERTGSDRKEQE